MKPIEQIALKLAAKLGWVPGHDDLADEVIGNIAAAIRARDQEWREAVEGVAKAELDAAKELLQHICDAPLKLELVTAERDQLRAEKLAR